MSFKQITIMGNLGKDPEIRTVGNATVGSFSVAVSEKFKNKEGEQVDKTTWFRVDAWQQGEKGLVSALIKPYLKKGQSVLIQGSPEIETFTKDGVEKQAFKIRLGGPGSTLRLCGGKREGGSNGNDAGGSANAGASAPGSLDDDIPF